MLRTLAVPAFFQLPSLAVEYTFLQQLKKVAKKRRSPAMLFIRLFGELSRPLLAVPDGEKLNLLSMPIDLLNSTNKRRALSREVNQKHRLRRFNMVLPAMVAGATKGAFIHKALY